MMNKDTPHFSPQELRAIYAAAAEKDERWHERGGTSLVSGPGGCAENAVLAARRRPGVSLQRRKLQQAGFYTAVLAR